MRVGGGRRGGSEEGEGRRGEGGDESRVKMANVYTRTMPHIYAQINPIILAMLMDTLNDNSIGLHPPLSFPLLSSPPFFHTNQNTAEYFEELLRILTFCTFYGDVAPMWPVFPLIATAHELWASDYIAGNTSLTPLSPTLSHPLLSPFYLTPM